MIRLGRAKERVALAFTQRVALTTAFYHTTTTTMYRQDALKKQRLTDSRRKHFGGAANFKPIDYPHRLNFYITPPTAEITLDQFEQWAIDRLRGHHSFPRIPVM